MKKYDVMTRKYNASKAIPVILVILMIVSQMSTAMGGGIPGAVLCIQPGDHVAVELAPVSNCHTAGNRAYLSFVHPGNVGSCTDIPLPATQQMVPGHRFPAATTLRVAVVSFRGRPAPGEGITCGFRHTIRPLHIQSYTHLRTVILRI